jgi:hypothetical protein
MPILVFSCDHACPCMFFVCSSLYVLDHLSLYVPLYVPLYVRLFCMLLYVAVGEKADVRLP